MEGAEGEGRSVSKGKLLQGHFWQISLTVQISHLIYISELAEPCASLL